MSGQSPRLRLRAAILVLVATAVLGESAFAAGSSEADAVRQYIGKLLLGRSSGLSERYAGTYAPLDGDIALRAESQFPYHRFLVADLFFSHWGPDDGSVKMLLVQDKSSGRIVAHCWAPWYSGHSEAFADLLRSYQPRSETEARQLVHTLAEVIAATSSGFTVGELDREGPDLVVPLLSDGRPWRILRAPHAENEEFGRMRTINPVTGEADPMSDGSATEAGSSLSTEQPVRQH